jgi:hypothetical protein
MRSVRFLIINFQGCQVLSRTEGQANIGNVQYPHVRVPRSPPLPKVTRNPGRRADCPEKRRNETNLAQGKLDQAFHQKSPSANHYHCKMRNMKTVPASLNARYCKGAMQILQGNILNKHRFSCFR